MGPELGAYVFKSVGVYSRYIVPLTQIGYGFGYIIIRSPYTPIFYLLKDDYTP